MTGAELLKMDEEDFSKSIQEMAIKDLMETISGLQKEMAKEQENFNSLSTELKNFKDRNSRQYKQISKDMVASQHRLTLLMNRSIKCFAQQNLHNSDSPLKRRNSAKGLPHAATPASASTNLQRSKSLLAVNQTDASHLPSSFQSPTKSHVAESGTSSNYSMTVSHVPVIMSTTRNSTVLKPAEAGVSSNVHDRSRQGSVSTDAVTSSKENIQQSTAASSVSGIRGVVESEGSLNCRDSANGVGHSNSATTSSGASGGMYVKRKPVQQARVTTTANISSSKFVTTTPPAPVPVSEPAAGTSSSLASAASSTTCPPTSRFSVPASMSSSTNESHFIKSKPLVSQSEYVSPLQMAQARKGVSKSQTLIKDTDSSYQGLRGLPSVKLLAQSFGSNTALNTISGPSYSTSYSGSQTNNFASASTGVYRSKSTLTFGNSQSAAAPTRIFISKEGAPEQVSQEPVVYVNGKSQQASKQHSRLPQTSTSNFNSEPTEWEKTRSKLRTVKRETVAETTSGNVNSAVVAPTTSQATIVSVKEQDSNSTPVDKYVKRKDNSSGKASTSVQSAPSVTINSINSSSSFASSRITNTVPPQASQNKSSSQTPFVSSTTPSIKTNNLNSASKHQGTSSNSPLNKTHTLPHSSTAQQKQQPSNTKMSYATLPHREPGSKERVTSAATVTIRRAKSREELQQIESDTRSNKDMVLKQIQARRRDAETHSDRPNIKAMSSLSQSMPSLLLDDTDGFHKGGDGSNSSPVKSGIALSAEKSAADFTTFVDDGIEMDEEDRVPRMNLRDWDPDPVYSVLYEVKLMEEVIEDISHQYITMEGLMEKLPMNKRKATLLKTWKRRFFRAKDGWLYYYESNSTGQPSESIQLMGGIIHDIGGRVLGIDDGRGRYLMVRCPTEKEYGQWKAALESQTADNTKATYVRPVLKSPRHTSKNVVIVDLGSSAIRAGILGQQACLPELFFPSLVAVDKDSNKVVAVGKDALRPNIRHRYKIIHPIRPSNKVDQFNIEVHLMQAIFDKVFHELNVNPSDYWVMISTPQNLGDSLKKGLMEILMDVLKVKGVCMVPQALLSLYSYNATSGIIVDIGHRMEILPIFDGFVIEGGVARCPYGAQKVQESMTTCLLSTNYKFFSTTEQLLVRYIMERVCYVAIDYPQEVEWFNSQPQTARTFVNFDKFALPDGSYTGVECDLARFKSPEGLFNVSMWEMDYRTLQKLVYQAIQTCPIDNRRHVWRAIFLSGGVTLLPGFAERLEKELSKLAPPGVPVEVHAAPQRYHAAFVGACSVALMPQFEGMAISKEEWKKDGVKAFKKWQGPSS